LQNISLYKKFFPEINGDVKEVKEDYFYKTPEKFPVKFETSIPTLEMISKILEEVLLIEESEAVAYVGFQKLSRAEAVHDRYHLIADKIKKVYMFGEKDKLLKPHSDIKFVYLPPRHDLIKEWFLIVDHPKRKSMLVAYDLDGFGKYEDEKKRNFIGFKTNNPLLVKKGIKLIKTIL